MQHDVMISYSSKNQKIAENMLKRLEESGIRCWLSSRNIKAGQSYPSEIVKAIKTAKAILLVLSNDFNDSPHTLNEVEIAFGLRIPIIPFKMETFEFNDEFEYFLSRVQSIEGFDNFDASMEKLIERLKEIVCENAVMSVQNNQPANNIQTDSNAENQVTEPSSSIGSESMAASIEFHFTGCIPELMGVFQELRSRVLAFGDDISVKATTYYIGFKAKKLFLQVRTSKKYLIITVDNRATNHKIYASTDIDPLMDTIRNAYVSA